MNDFEERLKETIQGIKSHNEEIIEDMKERYSEKKFAKEIKHQMEDEVKKKNKIEIERDIEHELKKKKKLRES
ncbi:hypothetical protein [Clostridium ihumii]|uniref:hypothetical protein n=1 Tax=Clostridium ihumii TaxID=1470356 RepID=UPI003D32ADAA